MKEENSFLSIVWRKPIHLIFKKNVKTVFSTGTKLETELKVAFTLVENISCKNSLLDHNFKSSI